MNHLIITYLRSCKRSLALSIVIKDVVAAGMMIMGVLEPGKHFFVVVKKINQLTAVIEQIENWIINAF